MAAYKCTICGYIFDEEKEGRPFSELEKCPICQAGPDKFIPVEETGIEPSPEPSEEPESEEPGTAPCGNPCTDLAHDKAFLRVDPSERYMAEIREMALTGHSIHGAMSTKLPMPSWNDILILGAQLDPPPLFDDDYVNTSTVIGRHAKRPMILSTPVYVSHMSFGALSEEIKTALAKGSAMARTAMCSGEGGILPAEKAAAHKYIFEYIPNKYSVTDENLRTSDAIEIKIGQGTKPGMGGHLPGSKVTPQVAKLRGRAEGEDIQSPSKFPEIGSREDLKDMVTMLRNRSDGRPVGIKIAAGHIERDLEYCVYAEPDFITIDGRGGATGSSPLLLREATTVPTIFALYRARKYLDSIRSDISLVITGGLRVSSDFAKALAMGADAVAVASAALIAAGCQQYRICGSGNCPAGIATQDPELRRRVKIDICAQRVANYLNVSTQELRTFARVTGHRDVHDLSVSDLVTTSREISEFTSIPHV